MSLQRRWLAATMVGDAPPALDADAHAGTLLACAIDEGVVALVHQRLTDDSNIPETLLKLFAEAARKSAVTSLLREAECRRVLSVLMGAGIPVLLLKGSALAWWLYPAAYLRECVDIDLLFSSREQAQAAVRLLAPHGYALNHSPDDLSYELICRREFGSMHVDLDIHWRLVDAPMFADTFSVTALQQASIPLPRLAPGARGLEPLDAFLHACIHRAANLYMGFGDKLKWLYDLHLLAQRMTPSDWSALQVRSSERGLCGICAVGIEASEDLFGNSVPNDALCSLRQAGAHEPLDASRLRDWKYMQKRNLAALPSLRMRARWLWQRLFPPVGYLREQYGADHSLASLWMQRAQRAVRRLRS